MALRVRLKLKLHHVVQKLRRRKPEGSGTSTQNALQRNAAAIEQAVDDPQPAFPLPSSEDLGPCRLLGLPVELLLQILELLSEPAPFCSSKPPYPLPSLRLLVHDSIFVLYSPYTQDMQGIVPPCHSSYLPNYQPRA